MNRVKNWTLIALVAVASVTSLGCQRAKPDLARSVTPVQISGRASKGPIKFARVRVYELGSTGLRGSLLGESITSSDGKFALSVNGGNAAEIVISEGSYIDEATGNPVELGAQELRLRLPEVSKKVEVGVTPLTEMAAIQSEFLIRQGVIAKDAIKGANDQMSQAAGLSDITISPSSPTDVSEAGSEAAKYALVLAGLSQQASDLGVPALDLSLALARDLGGDGVFDGVDSNGTIVTLGAGSLSPNAWVTGMDTAMINFKIANPSSALAGVSSPVLNERPELVLPSGSGSVGQVSNLTFTWNNDEGAIDLQWQGVSALGTVVHYRLYRVLDDVDYLLADDITGNHYRFSGAENGKDYSFKVQAVSKTSGALGAKSAIYTFSAPLEQVSGISFAWDDDDHTINIYWNSVSIPGSATRYRVYRVLNGEDQELVSNFSGTQYWFNNAEYGSTYTFKVQAVSADSGAEGVKSAPQTYQVPLDSVTNFTISSVGMNSVTLTWDTNANAHTYRVYRRLSSSGALFELLGNVTSPTYIDSTVSSSISYDYRVIFVKPSGVISAPSPILTVTPSGH